MKYIERYSEIVQAGLDEVIASEKEKMFAVAKKLADVIAKDGLIYIFGCGHSHILAEDVFYRAGGLASVRPIFIEPLMLHEGAAASSVLEKRHGYVSPLVEHFPVGPQDALIVISTSGINPVPIEVAEWSRDRGAFTVALTSFRYCTAQSSRHHSGNYLKDCVDVAIDNKVPVGDAVLSATSFPVGFSPVSSLHGIFILQAILGETTGQLIHSGIRPPVFISGNITGAEENNHALLKYYGGVIPELTNNLNNI